MILIELNDVGLRVHADGAIGAESPGFAHLGRQEITLGTAATQRAKLAPTQTEQEFWHRFGRTELRQKHPQVRYQADLAYLHLQALWQPYADRKDPVVIAVPGDFDREQVALLLGVAARIGIPVRAVIDLAVAASQRPQPGRHLYHLDIHLHRAVLSRLDQGPALALKQVAVSPEVGLLRLFDIWAHAVAGIFVNTTRFDPMHEAGVEQRLYDQLAGWADVLADDDQVSIALEHGGRSYTAELHRRTILRAAQPIYQRLTELLTEHLPEADPVTVQLSDRAARLPGIAETLLDLPQTQVLSLDADAAGQGLERLYLPRDTGEGVPFVQSKPWFDRERLDRHAQALAGLERRRPTHVLLGAVARPLGSRLAVGSGVNGGGLKLEGEGVADRHLVIEDRDQRVVLSALGGEARINGRDAKAGQILAAGDRLRIGSGGTELVLIAVEDHGT